MASWKLSWWSYVWRKAPYWAPGLHVGHSSIWIPIPRAGDGGDHLALHHFVPMYETQMWILIETYLISWLKLAVKMCMFFSLHLLAESLWSIQDNPSDVSLIFSSLWLIWFYDSRTCCFDTYVLILDSALYYQKYHFFWEDRIYPTQPRITSRLVLLWLLATVRCVFLITEQPLSSVMPAFPYIAFFESVIGKLLPWQWISMCHGSTS